jgi:hypothetical protein
MAWLSRFQERHRLDSPEIKKDSGEHQSNKNIDPPSRVSKHDVPNKVMTSRTPPSSWSDSKPRLSPRDHYQPPVRERWIGQITFVTPRTKGNDTNGRHPHWRWPKRGMIFIRNTHTPPTFPTGMGQHCPCWITLPPPHCHTLVAITSWYTWHRTQCYGHHLPPPPWTRSRNLILQLQNAASITRTVMH